MTNEREIKDQIDKLNKKIDNLEERTRNALHELHKGVWQAKIDTFECLERVFGSIKGGIRESFRDAFENSVVDEFFKKYQKEKIDEVRRKVKKTEKSEENNAT